MTIAKALRRATVLVTSLALFGLAAACASDSASSSPYDYFVVPEQFSLQMPKKWDMAMGSRISSDGLAKNETLVMVADENKPDLQVWVVRTQLDGRSLEDLVKQWSGNERMGWTNFSGFTASESRGQTTTRGEGTKRGKSGTDGAKVAIYWTQARGSEAWILGCESIGPLSDTGHDVCNTAIESFQIGAAAH